MKEAAIALMGEQEKSYWWHVSCRLYWQTILRRWLPTDRHSGKVRRVGPHPELYNPGPSFAPLRAGGQGRMTGERRLHIVDVGCGTGINLIMLREFGEVVGIDRSPTALEFASQYGPVASGDALQLPQLDKSTDLITAFDLLEHLPDDAAAISEWGRVLKPGGHLMISAPAYQWLYGPRDKAFMHYRRYDRKGLARLVSQSGFYPVFSTYLFAVTFPLFMLQRLVGQLANQPSDYTPVPPIVNQLLIWLGQLEAKWLWCWPLPFGSSVVILARKL